MLSTEAATIAASMLTLLFGGYGCLQACGVSGVFLLLTSKAWASLPPLTKDAAWSAHVPTT